MTRMTVKNLLEVRKQAERPRNEELVKAKRCLYRILEQIPYDELTTRETDIWCLLNDDPEIEKD